MIQQALDENCFDSCFTQFVLTENFLQDFDCDGVENLLSGPPEIGLLFVALFRCHWHPWGHLQCLFVRWALLYLRREGNGRHGEYQIGDFEVDFFEFWVYFSRYIY